MNGLRLEGRMRMSDDNTSGFGATTAMVGLVALMTASCIALPSPIDETPAQAGGSGGGGSAGGGGTMSDGGGGGGGGLGGAGGQAATALPVCQGAEGASCATITKLALGDDHSCALSSDGYLRCWGSNLWGELGDPELVGYSNHPPRLVPTVDGVSDVACGGNHVCVLIDTEVRCWGANFYGQVGAAGTDPVTVPHVVDLPPVKAIAVRLSATCALAIDGTVWCWGKHLNGQQWNGTGYTSSPVQVGGLEGMTVDRISVGSIHGCAVSAGGLEVRCWGNNDAGQLGDGTLNSHVAAVSVANSIATPIHTMSVGSGRACWVGGTPAELQCVGTFDGVVYAEPANVAGLPVVGIAEAAVGWGHNCLLDVNGEVSCFGLGFYGELGSLGGNGEWYGQPVSVLGDATSLFSGWQYSCVVLESGTVQCWGRNHRGQVSPFDPSSEVREPATIVFDDGQGL
jgi:alpha-tubulin suppressor-like RCC1 family protein